MSEVKSGAILAYANVAAINIVSLVYTPIVVRMLGQGDYGVYRLSNSVVTSLSLLSFGFGVAYVRFYARLKVNDDSKGIASLNGLYLILFTIMGLLAALGGWCLVVFSHHLFSSSFTADELSLAKTLMVFMTINIALTFPISVFNSYVLVHERFKWIYGVMITLRFLGPIAGTIMLVLGWGAIGASR